MAFRADEAIHNGTEHAKRYLVRKEFSLEDQQRSEEKLLDIIDEYGPVIDTYPSWHPLVTNHNERHPQIWPNKESGYRGLDHTIGFVNAFITCPYDDGQDVLDSVDSLACHPLVSVKAERLDVKFYQPQATPILVTCDWGKPIESNNMIPASIALPLLLQKEVPGWEWAERGETWESMRPYFLGAPHGSRSSLFVNQETAMTMKKVWNLLINTGMYGPIKVSNQY